MKCFYFQFFIHLFFSKHTHFFKDLFFLFLMTCLCVLMYVSTPACKEQDGPGAGDTYGCELFE